MLVKCPKCGFDQPKDTYCANCGIEMDNYKPIKTPLWKQVLKSPLFSLISLLLLGYGVLTALKNPSLFENPTMNLTTSRPIQKIPVKAVDTEATPLPTGASASVIEPTPSATPPSEVSTIPTSPPIEADLTNVKQPPPEADLSENEKDRSSQNLVKIENIKGPLELDIRFVEAPISQIQRFQSEASDDASGDTGEMRFAIVKNATKWLNHPTFIELDRITKKVPGLKKKIQWFSGTQEPETEAPFGLNFQVSIQERSGGHISGDIFISRSLVDRSTTEPMTIRKEFMTQFETDVGSVIGMTGLMPHNPIRSEEKEWLQDSLLRVFLSTPYLQGETDLMVLLQFKSDSK
jgi:hypothetical protein